MKNRMMIIFNCISENSKKKKDDYLYFRNSKKHNVKPAIISCTCNDKIAGFIMIIIFNCISQNNKNRNNDHFLLYFKKNCKKQNDDHV
jgi:hypothetical protein